MSDKNPPVLEEDLDALLAELEAAVGVESKSPVVAAAPEAPAPAPAAEPEPLPDTDDVDAELRALESAIVTTAEATSAPVAEPEPLPEATPEPAPAPTRTRRTKAATPAEVVTEPVPAPVAEPEPETITVSSITAATITAGALGEPAVAAVAAPADEEVRADSASRKGGLQFYVDVEDFKRTTAVSDTNLDNCIMEQSSLRAHYGVQAAHAEAQHARLKARFEVREASLYDKHRKLLAEGGEKVTEKAIENAVKLDPEWIRAKNAVIEADTIANINRSLVFSLADRRDMLIQLGSDRRQEMAGTLRITARDDLETRARSAAGQVRAA